MELDFEKDGIIVFDGFIEAISLSRINAELDKLMASASLNGSAGCVWLSNDYKTLAVPTYLLRSVNLLEIAIKIHDKFRHLPKYCKENYVLTNIEFFEEKNTTPLIWHTDNRLGMLRAFLFLEGGRVDSGALKYMKGSHVRDYYVEHELDLHRIHELQSTISIAEAREGSVVLADTMGFHSNQPRVKKRRVIVFEFQPKNSNYPRSPIALGSFHLSQEVIKNIALFQNDANPNLHNHGADYLLFNNESNFPRQFIVGTLLSIMRFLYRKLKFKIIKSVKV
jgi:hypothetical protein